MLNLMLTTDKLSVILSSAADTDTHVSGVDVDNTTPSAQIFVPYKANFARVTAATHDIDTVPVASHYKNVKFISIRNRHASTAQDVTVQFDANAVLYQLFKCTLAAGEMLQMNDGVFYHYDVYGGVYGPQLPVASDTVQGAIEIASQAEMEAGTDTTRAVTPGRFKFHPASPKAWVVCGIAADIQQSFGVSSITDTGVGDMTVTFTTAFAAATYLVQVSVENPNTTYAVANERKPHIRTGGRAVGSCRFICIDSTATTHLVKDPTTWHCVFYGDLP